MLAAAIKSNDKKLFDELIGLYENINEIDEHGKTPLMYACGMSVNSSGMRYDGEFWSGSDASRESFKKSLYNYFDSINILIKLLDKHARLDIQDNQGETALFYAIDTLEHDLYDAHPFVKLYSDKLNILVDYASSYDLNIMNKGEWTPIMRLFNRCSRLCSILPITKKMLNKGAIITFDQVEFVRRRTSLLFGVYNTLTEMAPIVHMESFLLCLDFGDVFISNEMLYNINNELCRKKY